MRLNLRRCDSLPDLLASLAERAANQYLELRHLALEVDGIDTSAQQSFDHNLESVLRHCKYLESYVFEWLESDIASEAVVLG